MRFLLGLAYPLRLLQAAKNAEGAWVVPSYSEVFDDSPDGINVNPPDNRDAMASAARGAPEGAIIQ